MNLTQTESPLRNVLASYVRLWRHAAVLAVALAGLWLGCAVAQAEAERSDRSTSRDSNDKSSTDKSADKDFTIGLDLPLRYSSSVTSASTESVIEARPDRHVTPEAYLKWAHQYDTFKASFELAASLDRYFKTPDANLDALHAGFKLAKTDGKWEYFVPYLSYGADMYFLPTFGQPDLTYQDVAIGFYSAIAWRDKERIPYQDSLIAFSDAGDPGDVSFNLDARFGRRMSDSTSYQNTFAAARLTGTYYISEFWRVEAALGARVRWYENYHDERRTDYRPSASLTLFWSPDWLKKIVKRSELALSIEYYRNYSNIPDKNYSLWEVGPTLSLRTKF